jgi:hypothetical protein
MPLAPRLAKNWPSAAATGVAVAVAVAAAAVVVVVGAVAAGEAVSAVAVWSAPRVSAPASVLSTPVALGAVTPVLADAVDAEAFSSGAALAAAVLAAEVAEAAAVLAGFGPLLGAGSTAAGVSLHLRQRYLLSRRSNLHRRPSPSRKATGISSLHEPNNVLRLGTRLSFAQQFGQLRHVGRDPPRLVAGEQLGC